MAGAFVCGGEVREIEESWVRGPAGQRGPEQLNNTEFQLLWSRTRHRN